MTAAPHKAVALGSMSVGCWGGGLDARLMSQWEAWGRWGKEGTCATHRGKGGSYDMMVWEMASI